MLLSAEKPSVKVGTRIDWVFLLLFLMEVLDRMGIALRAVGIAWASFGVWIISSSIGQAE